MAYLKLVLESLTSDCWAAARIFLSSLRFLLMIIAMVTGLSWKRLWNTRFGLTQAQSLACCNLFFLNCLLLNDSEAVTQMLKGNGHVTSCRHLQVPLDLADVVLVQEVFLHRKAAVLVIQLGQKIMKPHGGQRLILHICNVVPLGKQRTDDSH